MIGVGRNESPLLAVGGEAGASKLVPVLAPLLGRFFGPLGGLNFRNGIGRPSACRCGVGVE